jgi:hypothetical protein
MINRLCGENITFNQVAKFTVPLQAELAGRLNDIIAKYYPET